MSTKPGDTIMGLGDALDLDDSGSSGSSSSSTSSDDSNRDTSRGNYDEREWYAHALIYEDEDGELKFETAPHDVTFYQVKETEHSAWEFDLIPSYVEKYWSDGSGFRRTCYIVKKVLDIDLLEDDEDTGRAFIREHPEEAITAINKAASKKTKPREFNQYRTCQVCGEEHHTIYDDFQEVDNACVCSDHTIEEIKDAELM